MQKTEKMFTGIERCPHFFVFLQAHEAYIKQIQHESKHHHLSSFTNRPYQNYCRLPTRLSVCTHRQHHKRTLLDENTKFGNTEGGTTHYYCPHRYAQRPARSRTNLDSTAKQPCHSPFLSYQFGRWNGHRHRWICRFDL